MTRVSFIKHPRFPAAMNHVRRMVHPNILAVSRTLRDVAFLHESKKMQQHKATVK